MKDTLTTMLKLCEQRKYEDVYEYTGDYRDYATASKKFCIKIIYRIRTLILYGKFEEAEQLCHEALKSKYVLTHYYELVYYYLFSTYYYRKLYIECMNLIKKLNRDDENHPELCRLLLHNLIVDGNNDLKDKFFNIPKYVFMGHILKKEDRYFNVEVNTLYETIKDNFDNAEVYYENLKCFRIFRCFNAGVSDYNNKKSCCDYIIVYYLINDPNSMLTCYLIDSPGTLKYCDITEELYQRQMDVKPLKRCIYKKNGIREKFNKRQSLKQD